MTSAGNRKATTATIIGSDKGGVGKSLIATLLVDAYDQARRPLAVVEIDHQRKLRTAMGARVNLSLGASADLGEIAKDRKQAERFYNPVFEHWSTTDSLTDLGANVTTQMFDWMSQCHIASLAAKVGICFRFVAVATPDDQALRSAFAALSKAVRHLGNSEYFLVLNAVFPGRGFDYYDNHPIFNDLRALRERIDLKIIYIPNCDSELMEYGRSRGLAPLAVFQNQDRLTEEMGLGLVEAHTEQKRLLDWITQVQEGLRPLFSDPAPRRAASAQPSAPRAEPMRVHELRQPEGLERRQEITPRSLESGAVVENLLDRRAEAFDERGVRMVHAGDRPLR